MESNFFNIIFLLAGIAGWYFCAFPTLRYMVDLAEGRFRWQFIMWFALLVASIFLIKFSLFSMFQWPAPGSWSSRLFFGFGLLAAYMLPFALAMMKGRKKF